MSVAAAIRVDPAGLACWCGSPRFEEQFRTSAFGLLRCLLCGCYRIDPPPITHDDQAASFYTGYYAKRRLPGCSAPDRPRSSRFWQVANAVRTLEQAGKRAADIGCGEGHLCHELKRAGWSHVIGVDVSRARIEAAQRLYPDGEFHDRPLEETGAAPASLDLIVMDNVVEHLPDPPVMLRTLRRYLTADGRLVLITPNMTSGHFLLLGRRWTPELAPHAHIYLFTPQSIAQLLSQAGFSVETVGSFHLPIYSPREWMARLASADVKGAIWRAAQELGGIYGRLIGTGPMLYAVGRIATSPERNGPAPL